MSQSKDVCPHCGNLVWETERYHIIDGQAEHVECVNHANPGQGADQTEREAAHSRDARGLKNG